MNLDNVEFVGFKTKNELKEYYQASDIFCSQTRGDVWGLVINEAMAMGLPVITTDKCVAGLELVHSGQNGFIVSVEDYKSLSHCIKKIGDNEELINRMSEKSRNIIKTYTVENMAYVHSCILKNKI